MKRKYKTTSYQRSSMSEPKHIVYVGKGENAIQAYCDFYNYPKKKNTKKPKTKQQDVKWKLIDTYWDKYNNKTIKTYRFDIDGEFSLQIKETIYSNYYYVNSCVFYMISHGNELIINIYSSLRTAKTGGERFLKRIGESIARFDRINKK